MVAQLRTAATEYLVTKLTIKTKSFWRKKLYVILIKMFWKKKLGIRKCDDFYIDLDLPFYAEANVKATGEIDFV